MVFPPQTSQRNAEDWDQMAKKKAAEKGPVTFRPDLVELHEPPDSSVDEVPF